MTSNSIKANELAETQRANRERERQGRTDLERKQAEYKYQKKAAQTKSVTDATGTMIKGLSEAGKLIAATAASNDRSFYDKLDPSLSNELRVSVNTYAGLPTAINGDTLFNDYEALGLPTYATGLNKISTMQKAAVFTYNFTPYIGDADGADNPTQNAIRLFNSKVRAANSGPATNYDSVDLFMVPLATDSFVYMQGWVERGIEIAKTVDNRDLSTQQGGLLTAHCYGNTNLARTFIDMSALIIAAANKARANYNALNIPYEFDYIKRHLFLTGNVFKDGDGICSNYHIMIPDGYYVYDELNSQLAFTDIRLTMRNIGYGQAAVQLISNIFANMLNPLLDSQTVATMSGDMLKAYGDMKTTMPFMPIEDVAITTNYKMQFITDIKYLQSFKNATIRQVTGTRNITQMMVNNETRLVIGDVSGATWLGLAQDCNSGELPDTNSVSEIGATSIQYYPANGIARLFDYYNNDISEEDQLYNLSFYNAVDSSNHIRDARSEIITKFQVSLFNISNGIVSNTAAEAYTFTSNYFVVESGYDSTVITEITAPVYEGFTRFCDISQFNFIPKIMFLCLSDSSDGPYWRGLLAWNRNNNRRFCDGNTLARIQSLSLISMFLPAGNHGYSGSTSHGRSKGRRKR